jgi:hypothetical protein
MGGQRIVDFGETIGAGTATKLVYPWLGRCARSSKARVDERSYTGASPA